MEGSRDRVRAWLDWQERRRLRDAAAGKPLRPPPPPPPPPPAQPAPVAPATHEYLADVASPETEEFDVAAAEGFTEEAPVLAPVAGGAAPPRDPVPRAPAVRADGDGAEAPEGRRATAVEALRRRRERLEAMGGGGGRRGWLPMAAAGILAALAIWFLVSLFQPFAGDGHGRVAVTIPRGSGLGDIARILDDRGVISSRFFFEARATIGGRRGDLKPGSYVLRRDMSYGAALDALAKGPPTNVFTFTIPEGRSRREVSRSLAGQLSGDYLAATKRSEVLNPRRYGARRARDLEGFLFPATYQLRRGRPVTTLVDQQLAAFRRQFASVDMRFARHRNLTPYDVIVIASMIEREAELPRERALIASVIYNRLRQGIPLGIDATIRFATDNWDRPLTSSELANPSPYNTRLHAGLPPGPIGSPGLASLQAAAHPARTRYLYYVVKPGGNGEHAFSTTYEQFQRDVARYNSARARRGGRSPASR